MMLEADVVMGTVNDTANNSTEKVPIMGHPPADEGDLSLQEFLETVVADGKHGIKLDFKSIEAFNGSRSMLEKHRANVSIRFVYSFEDRDCQAGRPGTIKQKIKYVAQTIFCDEDTL